MVDYILCLFMAVCILTKKQLFIKLKAGSLQSKKVLEKQEVQWEVRNSSANEL